MDQIRRNRLEELLREEISALIVSGGIKDPRVGSLISISRVEANRDGSHAKVWVSCLEDDKAALESAVLGLESAAGFIQSQIGRKVRLRLTPILHFVPDPGIKEGFEMVGKLKDLLGQ
ncbi:MAG: 30S ribosome-binding factor RbfA [Spirochaetia bacterium]|jgi:ribosome-binding factor A|nr:30S ribosome-binding factor RbfA [Spirochaetales bacterium]MDX9784238.1 30S ribosome-binding factor RbfA [Spirochaetia bacterium]